MGSPAEQGEIMREMAISGDLSAVDDSPFRFFDLPRELRDAIYDNALVDVEFKLTAKRRPSDSSGERSQMPGAESALDEVPEYPQPPRQLGLRASMTSRADFGILLSNKAAKQEYEERADKATTLVLKDSEHYSFQQFVLPEQAKHVKSVELHTILFCHLCSTMLHLDDKTCQAAHEVGQHLSWIEDLLAQLPKLHSFSITAYVCYDRYKTTDETKIPCQAIVENKIEEFRKLPKLKELTLLKKNFAANPELDGTGDLMMKWPAPEHPESIDRSRVTSNQYENPLQVEKVEDVAADENSKRVDSVA